MDRTIGAWIGQAGNPGLIVLAHLLAQDPRGEASERILAICRQLADSHTSELLQLFLMRLRHPEWSSEQLAAEVAKPG